MLVDAVCWSGGWLEDGWVCNYYFLQTQPLRAEPLRSSVFLVFIFLRMIWLCVVQCRKYGSSYTMRCLLRSVMHNVINGSTLDTACAVVSIIKSIAIYLRIHSADGDVRCLETIRP